MASIKIHQDQENIVPDLRLKQRNKNPMAAQSKRPVLTAINGNKTQNPTKGKLPLKPSSVQSCSNVRIKNRHNNFGIPVVPVAQFEAFKVYEDEEEQMARIDERLEMFRKTHMYKGTADDEFITEAKLAEIERLELLENEERELGERDEQELAEREERELAEREERELTEIERNNFSDEEEESDIQVKSELSPHSPMSVEKSSDKSSLLVKDLIQSSGTYSNSLFTMDEYRDDIFAYLKQRELRHRPKSGYISKQPDVTKSMRAILVDWLVEVAEEYCMHTETLYLAVNFIDRFLSYMSVVRAKLQLVGTAAIFIAAKYEEIFPPDVKEFVYITDDTYDKHQVIRMEHLILRVLSFDLSVPTACTFINHLSISAKLTQKSVYLALYLSELALLEVEPYLTFLPSIMAAAAIALARHTLGEDVWSDTLTETSGYTLPQLKKCIEFLNDLFIKVPTMSQHASQDKYNERKLMHVSKLQPNSEPINFE